MGLTKQEKLNRVWDSAHAALAREEAREQLREMFPPGSTAKTILRHVTSSGMGRSISVISPECEDITWLVMRAGDFGRFDDRNGGIKRGGCGMDMGFDLVYSLSRTLYRDGFECAGAGEVSFHTACPSNDHSNGDRDYSPHHHSDGGYAISQRWL
jgi:hypothetical protein